VSLTALALTALTISRLSAQEPRPVFRSGASLVSVDVIVRDRDGGIVRGLTAKDFTLFEDGKPQDIQTFSFEEIAAVPAGGAAGAVRNAGLLEGVADRLDTEVQRAPGTAATVAAEKAGDAVTAAEFAGRRLVVLLFDVSSMEPTDVQRAVDSATDYVRDQMSASDLVAIVTIGSTLTVLTDFTNVREDVSAALLQLAYTDGTATPPVTAATTATDEVDAAAETAAADETGFESFNNDVRLRALKTLAETLAPIEQKKAILYFSAGMARTGSDNQVELRAAINAAVRGNVAIYPVDSRGLQAIAPGGDASQASGRGVSLFTGQGVQRQFASLTGSQETLTTLAADTGGRAFTDSNSFGDAFARVQRDLSAYYLIGYSSTNPAQDGRFRRIQVRVSRTGTRVEARAGYYAARDFRNTNRGDRESQLEEQLAAAVSATDVPVVVGSGWFRQSADRFYVPIALAIPGSAVPVTPGATKVSIDVRGVVRDEQGRNIARIRETMELPSGAGTTLAGKQVMYQSGVVLPPGRFSVKVVVRENASGLVGSFEAPLVVPQLRNADLKMSSVVLSTQLQPVTGNPQGNPLVKDGVQLLPNLTRVVTRGQNVYFYYEVYDPGRAEQAAEVKTTLAFYRGGVKVYETPLVERTMLDEPNRGSVVFRFEVPARAFTPGTYVCQINVIDAVAGRFAFPRLTFQVREQ
jgi:VWFA-related protein